MRKLNKRKIKWIVREIERRENGLYTIAKTQNITPQHTCYVYRKYRNCKDPVLLRPGRKPKQITDEERKIVIQAYKEIRASATMIEQYLDEKGVHINHNRIHRILLEAKLAKEEQRKKNRRTWVRYERKHSLSWGILIGLNTKANKASSSLMMHQDSSQVMENLIMQILTTR